MTMILFCFIFSNTYSQNVRVTTTIATTTITSTSSITTTILQNNTNKKTLALIKFLSNSSFWKSQGFTVYNLSNIIGSNWTENNTNTSTNIKVNNLKLKLPMISSFNSNSWSGYYVANDPGDPIYNSVTATYASWIVQPVSVTTGIFGTDRWSTQWTGIGGLLYDPTLIQIGTQSNSKTTLVACGIHVAYLTYYSYYELVSPTGCQIPITNSISYNDTINAFIIFIKNNTNGTQKWFLYINDTTKKWTFSANVSYKSNESKADFIDEITCKNSICTLPTEPPANWSIGYFGNDFTHSNIVVNTIFGNVPVNTLSATINGKNLTLNSSSNVARVCIQSIPNVCNYTVNRITQDQSSFGVSGSNLSVKIDKHNLGSNTVLFANVTTNAIHLANITYKWYLAGHNFSTSNIIGTSNTINVSSNTVNIYSVFIKDNGAKSKPVAYNYTMINSTISILASIPINLTNTQSKPTPSIFQQEINVNSLAYNEINANWTNVEFSTGNDSTGNILQAWIQSNPFGSSTNTTVWIKLTNSIEPDSNATIYMNILPYSILSANGPIGEAPQLSCHNPSNTINCTYGQYDNGANVFNFYVNFSCFGASLPCAFPSVFNAPQSNTAEREFVENGFVINATSNSTSYFGIQTKNTYKNSTVFEGLINSYQATTANVYPSIYLEEATNNTYLPASGGFINGFAYSKETTATPMGLINPLIGNCPPCDYLYQFYQGGANPIQPMRSHVLPVIGSIWWNTTSLNAQNESIQETPGTSAGATYSNPSLNSSIYYSIGEAGQNHGLSSYIQYVRSRNAPPADTMPTVTFLDN
ncbi:MAG: hypothetical protein ABR981_02120 [Candidatus Micrarchaeaceae archaeon]